MSTALNHESAVAKAEAGTRVLTSIQIRIFMIRIMGAIPTAAAM